LKTAIKSCWTPKPSVKCYFASFNIKYCSVVLECTSLLSALLGVWFWWLWFD